MKEKKERKFHHLTPTDRAIIEKYLKRKIPIREIAADLGVSRVTIYREIKRGLCVQMTSDLIMEERYCADVAQAKYERNMEGKGPGLKIGKDHALAAYIEAKILYEDYSPAAVLAEIERNPDLHFSVTICEWTLYKYIDQGVFLHLTNKALPFKKKRKKHYKKVSKSTRAPSGTSIEQRPAEVDTREVFGDWEMDSVKGVKRTKPGIVALTERKTRHEIAVKVEDGTAESVVAVLDALERKFGPSFSKVFRTITVDNGTEFSDTEGMERSILHPGRRTRVYYCHPYRSSERGSNEKQNQLLRRRFPKGTDFRKVNDGEVEVAVAWLNRYPREILGWATSEELFMAELSAIV